MSSEIADAASDRMPKPGRPSKARHGVKYCVHVDAQTDELIRTFLATNASGHVPVSRSQLFSRAVRRYLKQEDTYWSLQFTMLEKLAEKFSGLELHVIILTEIVLHFLDYWFTLWPDRSPEEDRDSLQKSYGMMAVFTDSLKENLRQGGHLWDLSLEHIKDLAVDTAKELNFAELAQIHKQAQEDRQERQKRGIDEQKPPAAPKAKHSQGKSN